MATTITKGTTVYWSNREWTVFGTWEHQGQEVLILHGEGYAHEDVLAAEVSLTPPEGYGDDDRDDDLGPTNYRWSLEIDGDAESFEVSSSTHGWSYTGGKDGAEWAVQLPNYHGLPGEACRFASEQDAVAFAVMALLSNFYDGSDGANAAEAAAERAYDR